MATLTEYMEGVIVSINDAMNTDSRITRVELLDDAMGDLEEAVRLANAELTDEDYEKVERELREGIPPREDGS